MVLVISPAAGGPTAADWLTAWGTIVTAVGALVAVGVTVWLARRDRERSKVDREQDRTRHEAELAVERRRASQDRADAERRFREEVERSERLVREERDEAERARRRDRQIDSASALIGRVARLIPYLDLVPGSAGFISVRRDHPSWNPKLLYTWEAVQGLRFGGDAEVAGLQDEQAAGQYRQLMYLVLTVAGGEVKGVPTQRLAGELRRYAHFVRVSLESLVERGASLDPGSPAFPRLGVKPGDEGWWSPEYQPEPWMAAIRTDPGDPMYAPAS